MELKWLEDFVSLARTGSFSRSAEERHITQPAFSRRIQALETWLGVSLIDRSTYPTTLTSAGQEFRETAEEAVRMLYGSRTALQASGGSQVWDWYIANSVHIAPLLPFATGLLTVVA